MKRNLSEVVQETTLESDLYFTNWTMDAPLDEQAYLDEDEVVVGGLMVWREEENCGYIEDVFVRLPWRKRGISKYMLTQALYYCKAHGLQSTYLMVLTSNNSALPSYESVVFITVQEEIRYYIDID